MNTLSLEGHIDIRLQLHQPCGQRVNIVSSRPLMVADLMVGKTPAEALKLVPLLFAVCGVAQSRAALLALQSYCRDEIDHSIEMAREMLLQIETAREHLLRIFIDWPGLFDLPAERAELPKSIDQVKVLKTALFADGDAFALDSRLQVDEQAAVLLVDRLQQDLEQRVFGIPLDQWLAIDRWKGLNDWSRRENTIAAFTIDYLCRQEWGPAAKSGCAHLPQLDNSELRQRFDSQCAEDFIAFPDWHGRLYETTPLSRQLDQPLVRELDARFGNSLITRWVARLVELACIPRRLRALLGQLRQGIGSEDCETMAQQGIAQVEAVRGRLIHRVSVDGDRIDRFQILAPTEWNFHPRGLIAQCLEGVAMTESENLERLARVVINAIDPCVGFRLVIERG